MYYKWSGVWYRSFHPFIRFKCDISTRFTGSLCSMFGRKYRIKKKPTWLCIESDVVFFLTLSGISCVTILKYTSILSPQFTKVQKTKQATKQKKQVILLVRQIILEINSLDMLTNDTSKLSIFSSPFTFYYFLFFYFDKYILFSSFAKWIPDE